MGFYENTDIFGIVYLQSWSFKKRFMTDMPFSHYIYLYISA